MQLLSQGRFRLGLESGENLNEHFIGAGWPAAHVRLDMLEESVGIIRSLFAGGYVSPPRSTPGPAGERPVWRGIRPWSARSETAAVRPSLLPGGGAAPRAASASRGRRPLAHLTCEEMP